MLSFILGKLFGSDESVSKTTDGIINGIDKAILTKEERLDINMKMLQLYEPFKVAQRLLALTFGIPYALAWFTIFLASFYTDVTKQLELMDGTMGQIVLAIVAFYFLGGTINGFKKG